LFSLSCQALTAQKPPVPVIRIRMAMLVQIVVQIIRRIPLTISGFNDGNQHMQCVYIKISARFCASLPAVARNYRIFLRLGVPKLGFGGAVRDDGLNTKARSFEDDTKKKACWHAGQGRRRVEMRGRPGESAALSLTAFSPSLPLTSTHRAMRGASIAALDESSRQPASFVSSSKLRAFVLNPLSSHPH